jgi:hypothetical protein
MGTVRHQRGSVSVALAVLATLVTGVTSWIAPVDVTPAGGPAVGSYVSIPDTSADGRYVVFASDAPNLVGDGVTGRHIYVRDARNGTTQRVDVADDGTASNGTSNRPQISDDGRLVTFSSTGTNLVPGWPVPFTFTAIYVHDRTTHHTEPVTLDTDGQPIPSGQAILSGNGRYAFFASSKPPSPKESWYIRDRSTGITTVIRRLANANGGATFDEFVTNSDGSVLVVDRCTAIAYDHFTWCTRHELEIWDWRQRTMVAPAPRQADVFLPTVSGNGRFVAYSTGTNGARTTWTYDRTTGTTELISVDRQGDLALGDGATISDNGRFVTFVSDSRELVPNDPGTGYQVYLRDRARSVTTLVSTAGDGTPADANTYGVLSGNGQYLALLSTATNLVGTAAGSQLFLRTAVAPAIATVTPTTLHRVAAHVTVTIRGSGFSAGATVAISRNGRSLPVSAVTRVGEGTITVVVDAPGSALAGPYDVVVTNRGSGPGPAAAAHVACTGCLRVT